MDVTRRQLVSTGLATGIGLAVTHLHAERGSAQASTNTTETRGHSGASLRAQVVLFDGFEVTDALAPFDVLKLAGKLGAAIECTLVSVNGATEVVALDDVHVKPTAAFDAGADILLVPGAPTLWRAGETPSGLIEAMRCFRQPGKTLATVCTGAVFAARAGLFTGRNATTHKAAHEVIVQEGAVLVPARVVDDGDLISSAGVTSGIDLALHLIERYFGAPLAIQVEQVIEYERRGVVWRA